MNRPEALNAFNTEQLEALLARVREVNDDESIRVAILTGEGKRSFAAGADIKEMSTKTAHEARAFAALGHAVTRDIETARIPWIAAVNGYALGGGCEMALACDIRIASENAQLGQPEVGLGIPPGWGGTQRLSHIVGKGLASELIFTGRRVAADEALRIGLVNAVYPLDELLDKVLELAEQIAVNAPVAVSLSKRAIRMSDDVDLHSGLDFEVHAFALTFATDDRTEGMSAFIEKRKPEFRGA
jgi:enoyl-CoA hydratase